MFVNSSSSNVTSFQPTLAALNHQTKMETEFNDLDDIGALFMKNSSPNVTLGVGPNIAAANSTVIKTGIILLSKKSQKSHFTLKSFSFF